MLPIVTFLSEPTHQLVSREMLAASGLVYLYVVYLIDFGCYSEGSGRGNFRGAGAEGGRAGRTS